MSEEAKSNSGAGLIDVEVMGNRVMASINNSTSDQILNWIEDMLRQGNIIYATDVTRNPIFERKIGGTFHIVVQPLRGKKPDIGNESPK